VFRIFAQALSPARRIARYPSLSRQRLLKGEARIGPPISPLPPFLSIRDYQCEAFGWRLGGDNCDIAMSLKQFHTHALRSTSRKVRGNSATSWHQERKRERCRHDRVLGCLKAMIAPWRAALPSSSGDQRGSIRFHRSIEISRSPFRPLRSSLCTVRPPVTSRRIHRPAPAVSMRGFSDAHQAGAPKPRCMASRSLTPAAQEWFLDANQV
jgi:hypothetical protein